MLWTFQKTDPIAEWIAKARQLIHATKTTVRCNRAIVSVCSPDQARTVVCDELCYFFPGRGIGNGVTLLLSASTILAVPSLRT